MLNAIKHAEFTQFIFSAESLSQHKENHHGMVDVGRNLHEWGRKKALAIIRKNGEERKWRAAWHTSSFAHIPVGCSL